MDVHVGRGLVNLYAMSIYVNCMTYTCAYDGVLCIYNLYICDLFDIYAWYIVKYNGFMLIKAKT
jgi:hypothetical protein